MTIAVDLGRKATKTNKTSSLINFESFNGPKIINHSPSNKKGFDKANYSSIGYCVVELKVDFEE